MGLIALIIIIILAVAILPYIFYLLSLQRALGKCSPENRALTPGLVWLLLIPVFSLIWNFIVVVKISQSLEAEFRSRNIPGQNSPGLGVGLAMCSLSFVAFIPWVGFLAAIAGFVCWIVYWVRISGYSSRLGPGRTSSAIQREVATTTDGYCGKCGSPVEAGSQFCAMCGQSVPV